MKCSLIMYHYVRNVKLNKFPNLKYLEIEKFKFQIKYLKRKYNFIRVDDLIDAVYSSKKLPTNSVLLTFDDGYSDHYENIFPILVKENISACFYPIANPIIYNTVSDVNKIHFILGSMKSFVNLKDEIFNILDILRLEGLQIEPNENLFNTLAEKGRYDESVVIFFKRLLQHKLEKDLRSLIINKLFNKYVTDNEAGFSNSLYLNKEKISEMLKFGMSFGNHTMSHPWLDKINKNEVQNEILNCFDFLNSFGVKDDQMTIAYPYGGYSNDVLDVVGKTKCKLGITTYPALTSVNFSNRLTLERLDTNDVPTS